jgi:hypothetical protein
LPIVEAKDAFDDSGEFRQLAIPRIAVDARAAVQLEE